MGWRDWEERREGLLWSGCKMNNFFKTKERKGGKEEGREGEREMREERGRGRERKYQIKKKPLAFAE